MINAVTMDDQPLTLTTVLERAERFYADRAVVTRRPDGSVARTTLGECALRARKLATALSVLGIGDGDRVATLLWNQTELLELCFAVPAMGAVLHTLDPRGPVEELGLAVRDARDRIMIVDESLLTVLQDLRGGFDFEHVIVVGQGGSLPEGMRDYATSVAAAAPMNWPILDEKRSAALLYTFDATAGARQAFCSHRALVLQSLSVALPDELGITSRDTLLPLVPMFHPDAWGLPYAAVLAGARIILPGPPLDPFAMLDLCAAEGVTVAVGAPASWLALLETLNVAPRRWNLSRFARLIVIGSVVARSMFEGFERHGLTLHQAWGMTEPGLLGSVHRIAPDLRVPKEWARIGSRAGR